LICDFLASPILLFPEKLLDLSQWRSFFQANIKAVSSNDLYVISLFHDLLLRPLTGCRQEKCNAAVGRFITAAAWMRRLPFVLLKSSLLTLRWQKGPPLIALVV
jgi:hypothetical protein